MCLHNLKMGRCDFLKKNAHLGTLINTRVSMFNQSIWHRVLLGMDAYIALKVKILFLTRVLCFIQLGFSSRRHVIDVVNPKVVIKEALMRLPSVICPHGALDVDVAHILRENSLHDLPNLTVVHLVPRSSMGTTSNHLQVNSSISRRRIACLGGKSTWGRIT
jgi:hypothetical protein